MTRNHSSLSLHQIRTHVIFTFQFSTAKSTFHLATRYVPWIPLEIPLRTVLIRTRNHFPPNATHFANYLSSVGDARFLISRCRCESRRRSTKEEKRETAANSQRSRYVDVFLIVLVLFIYSHRHAGTVDRARASFRQSLRLGSNLRRGGLRLAGYLTPPSDVTAAEEEADTLEKW